MNPAFILSLSVKMTKLQRPSLSAFKIYGKLQVTLYAAQNTANENGDKVRENEGQKGHSKGHLTRIEVSVIKIDTITRFNARLIRKHVFWCMEHVFCEKWARTSVLY